jgi:hypothetical protein
MSRVGSFEIPPAKQTSSAILQFVLESRTLYVSKGCFAGGQSVCRRLASRCDGIKNYVSALLFFYFWNFVWPVAGRATVGSARMPPYIWASKVFMYFVVCYVVTEWIAWGCYFYLLLMLRYCLWNFILCIYFSLFFGPFWCKRIVGLIRGNATWTEICN